LIDTIESTKGWFNRNKKGKTALSQRWKKRKEAM
jgi:hypothetical protein